MSMWPAPAIFLPRLREPHADGGIGDRRAEDRHVGAIGRREDAVASRRRPEMAAEQVEEFTGRVGAQLERGGEIGDPDVVGDELVLARVGVVDAIDVLVGERRVVGVRRSDVVVLAAGLVQIVIKVGAGGHEAVDVAVRDEMATISRRPPALSAPAIPRKIVTSSSSIFCQMRCAPSRGCVPETRSAPCARGSRPLSGPFPPRTARSASAGNVTSFSFASIRPQIRLKRTTSVRLVGGGDARDVGGGKENSRWERDGT